MSGAQPTWNEKHLVPITQGGLHEDIYWTHSYSPLLSEDVAGALAACCWWRLT